MLLGVLIFQFLEKVPDRQAVDLVKYHLGWKLALNLKLSEGGFHPTTLVYFRQRLIEHAKADVAMRAVLAALQKEGLIPKRSKQRLDSTHVLSAVSDLSALECVRETPRLALEEVARGLEKSERPDFWELFWERYVESKLDYKSGQAVFQNKHQCSRLKEAKRQKVSFRFEWSYHCRSCPLRSECVPAGQSHRSIVIGQYHDLLQQRRRDQQTQQFKERMQQRNAIEGTISELARAHGLRRSRERGFAKVELQNLFIGAACNVKRWLRIVAETKSGSNTRLLPFRNGLYRIRGVCGAFRLNWNSFSCPIQEAAFLIAA